MLGEKIVLLRWFVAGLGGLNYTFTFLFGWDRFLFGGVVALISSAVIMFSRYYMADDARVDLFFKLVLLFILRMLFLIYGVDLVRIVLGWDGLGLTSFVLVIYYKNKKSLSAGIITALSNRVGDAALLIRIALLRAKGNFLNFGGTPTTLLGVILLLVGITKRAQVPFSAWLPAAMAAPTPVSALVHSSTLVTAGIYVIYRFSSFIPDSVLLNLSLIGMATAFISGIRALREKDFKKVIALSTLRQLGFIMFCLGCGLQTLAFFHLLRHALFKALLFLCVGVYIHSSLGEQNIFLISIFSPLPVASSIIFVSSISLSGLPFLRGFYSKDLILERLIAGDFNILFFLRMTLRASITLLYSARLLFLRVVSQGENLLSSSTMERGEKFLVFPLFFLARGAIAGGSILRWFIFKSPVVGVFPFVWKINLIFVNSLLIFFLIFLNKKDWTPSKRVGLFWAFIWFLPPLSGQRATKGGIDVRTKLNFSFNQWGEMFGPRGVYRKLSYPTSLARI